MHRADVNAGIPDLQYCPTKLFRMDCLDRAPSRKRQSSRFLDSPPAVPAISKSYTIEVILRKQKQDGKSGCNQKVSKPDNDQFKTKLKRKQDGKSGCNKDREGLRLFAESKALMTCFDFSNFFILAEFAI